MSKAEELDHTVFGRGKYSASRGNPKTPSEVAEFDPRYIVWCYETWGDPRPCSHLLYRDCKNDVARDLNSQRVAREQDVE